MDQTTSKDLQYHADQNLAGKAACEPCLGLGVQIAHKIEQAWIPLCLSCLCFSIYDIIGAHTQVMRD
jgi:hypothetical protein